MSKPEYSSLTQALMDYLDCPCRYFAPMKDDDSLVEAFREAQARGKTQGFTPVIVAAEDETLLECLTMNAAGEDGTDENDRVDMDVVRAYRRDVLALPSDSGEDALARFMAAREEECAEDGCDYGFDGKIASDDDVPETEDRFYGYWDFSSRRTMPVVIAEIPTDKPWEVFAWLPFGNWNECPDTADLIAVAKGWFQRYGAVPSVMTHDTLDFELPRPIPVTDAMTVAKEHFAFCPDVIYSAEEDYNAGILAATLLKACFWSFWWD